MLSLSIGMTGFQTVFRQKNRALQLAQCVDLIQTISAEIGYGCFPLPDILQRAAENEAFSALTFLKTVPKETRSDFSLGWKNCIENARTLALRQEEKSLLIQFGKSLGTTDTDTQLILCERYRLALAQRLEAAQKRYSECKRLYYGCSVIAALLLFALIL